MIYRTALLALVVSALGTSAQTPAVRPAFEAFEVATVKRVEPDAKAGRYITMQGTHRFVVKDYTVKGLIAAAYSLNPRSISGGPEWTDSDHFDIVAVTSGEARPNHEEQMVMLRGLLTERFKLTFHREQKESPIYALEVAKGGTKLKASLGGANDAPVVGPAILYEGSQRVKLPVRNATLGDFATLMQRAILDRPVVDETGLMGKFDFDLEWAADETQFGGSVPAASAETQAASLFTAIQEQLGLRFVATKGPVEALVVDRAAQPEAD